MTSQPEAAHTIPAVMRHSGPHDDDAFEELVHELLEGFESDTGYDGWVPHQLLHLKRSWLDGRPTTWRVDDLRVILLEAFPRKVTLDPEDVDTLIPTVRAFLRWLHETRGLSGGDPLPRLLHALDGMAPEVHQAVQDPTRFGPAKSIAAMLGQAGIELDDQVGVQAFIDEFNARPQEERTALLPLPGDRPPPFFDAIGPMPPARALGEADLAAAARQAPLYRWVTGLVDHIGDGRPLTKTGNLRLADGLAMVDALGLADIERRSEWGGKVQSTAELPDLDLTFRVARAAGFVKVQHGKVLPTKRAGDLGGAPHRAWPRVVEGLLKVGILQHRYARQQYFVPPWVDHLDDSLLRLLVLLHLADEPVPIDDLVEMARDDLTAIWEIPGGPGEDAHAALSTWWNVPDHNVRQQLRRLEEAGVVQVAGVEVVPREHWGHDEHGGTATLTPFGRIVATERARANGAEVIEAGRLVDLEPVPLLAALTTVDTVTGQAEVEAWIDARGPLPALAGVVGATHGEGSHDVLRAVAAVILACGARLEAEEAAPHLQDLIDHRILGPLVSGWLLEHGVDPLPSSAAGRGRADGLVSMAVLGAVDGAVMALQSLGDSAEQRDLIEEARTTAGADAVPFLEGVADLHEDKAVAKAARKALFRLGVRRSPVRR